MSDVTSPEQQAAQLRKSQAEAEKAEHDAKAASVTAAKAQSEYDEWLQAAETRERDAAAASREKTLANENKELENEEQRLSNLGTQRSWLSDLSVDLKGLDKGKTDVEGTMFQSLLTSRALRAAAVNVAKSLAARGLAKPAKVLVTSDEALVQRLAAYRGTLHQLSVIRGLVEQALDSMPTPRAPKSRMIAPAGALLSGVGSAVAKTLPGLLSLISANRTVKAGASDLDDTVVVMAVAGALIGLEPELRVLLDETRLIPEDTEINKEFVSLQAVATQLGTAIDGIEGREDDLAKVWLKEARLALQTAQETLRALTSVPEGAELSPLAAAMAQAVFVDPALGFVLVVRPAGASTIQLVSDRPLAMKDPVHVQADAAIAYALIAVPDSHVTYAGIATGDASLVGRIGSTLAVEMP